MRKPFAPWLGLLAITAWALACNAPDIAEFQPAVTHIGPVLAQEDDVSVQVTVYDRDDEPAEAALSLCLPGENCNGGGCTPLKDQRASLRLRNTTGTLWFAPGCTALEDVDEVFTLCATANGGAGLVSTPVSLSELGFDEVPSCGEDLQ